MDEVTAEFAPRLDAISTRWSLVRRAHGDASSTTGDARNALVLRYSSSVRKYVGALCRNEEDADEISQEVVVRMLRGDFGGADADRGRFRDLLKVSIKNMVRNFWAKQKRRTPADIEVELADPGTRDAENDPWLIAFRNNILDLAFADLEHYQRKNPGNIAYALLKLRADYPEDTSDQLAQRLSDRMGKAYRADAVRQQLRRARMRFAEILMEEVADGLDEPSPARVEDELIALGLIEHVREFLPSGWRDG